MNDRLNIQINSRLNLTGKNLEKTYKRNTCFAGLSALLNLRVEQNGISKPQMFPRSSVTRFCENLQSVLPFLEGLFIIRQIVNILVQKKMWKFLLL